MPGWPAAVTATESPSQLIPSHHVQVESSAQGAAERKAVQPAFGTAARAQPGRRHLLDLELRTLERRALRHQLEGKLESRRHNLAEVSDFDLHLRAAAAGRMVA